MTTLVSLTPPNIHIEVIYKSSYLTAECTHVKLVVMFVKTSGKNRDWQKIGQLTDLISELPITGNIESRDFDFKISGNAKGAAARIDGIEVWFDAKQSNF